MTRTLIRKLGNKFGLAWWAKIETNEPLATYWYGPFLTRSSLKKNLAFFVDDLTNEGSKNIKQTIVRCKKEEPLTV